VVPAEIIITKNNKRVIVSFIYYKLSNKKTQSIHLVKSECYISKIETWNHKV